MSDPDETDGEYNCRQTWAAIREERRREVARLHAKGWGTAAIAEFLGVFTAEVSRHKRALGLPVKHRPGRPRPNIEVRDRVRELHGQGMGTRDIARELGVSGSAVSRHKVALGLIEADSRARQIQAAHDRRHRAAAMRAKGMPVHTIAARLGVADNTIRADLARVRRDDRSAAAAEKAA